MMTKVDPSQYGLLSGKEQSLNRIIPEREERLNDMGVALPKMPRQTLLEKVAYHDELGRLFGIHRPRTANEHRY